MNTQDMNDMGELDDEFADLSEDEVLKRAEAARAAMLSGFAASIADRRKEAVEGRLLSGVEEMWREDEEYYDGVDEANRTETYNKPSTSSGRVTRSGSRDLDGSVKSTVFVNITQPYVNMASARVADILLPTDDKPFRIKPTPIPELGPMMYDYETMMPGGHMSVGKAANDFVTAMASKASRAEQQIWDWLCESRWHTEFRKQIEQCAKLGAAVLKGPYPVKRKSRKVTKNEEGGMSLTIGDEIKPASRWVDIWNIYPDPSCGDNIHNGRYIFERGDISARELRDMKGTGYLDTQIDEVLKEGPGRRNLDTGRREIVKDNEMFEVWYYYGFATKEDMLVSGCKCSEKQQNLDGLYPVQIVMVNDRIIKASISVFDSGEFPYDVMRWTYVAGSWFGHGVARQVRTSQRMINAACRNLMDNAGIAAGPQIVMNDAGIYPADDNWEITPFKIWRMNGEADIQEVAHAFMTFEFPTRQQELQAIIQLALDFAERSTSMPLILQGQQGAATETVGGMQILNQNASSVLRRIAKISDDHVIEPHILRYYEWLMVYGEDDSAKGDYTVDALGSTSFYERDAQNQAIMGMMQMANDPELKLSKEKLMTEFLKAIKVSPERVQMSDQEYKQKMEALAKNPPKDPRVEGQLEVAQLKQQGEMQKAQLVQQSDMQELEFKRQSDQSNMQLKLEMQRMEQEHQEKLKRMEYEMKMMELSQSQQISLDSIKASLASDTMKLKTQKELSMMTGKAKQVSMPETEPVGQAPAGQAYQR